MTDQPGTTEQAATTGQQGGNDHGATPGSGNAETMSEAPTFMPATDIVETKDAVIMVLDVPGADPGSLNVALEKQELRVTARATSPAPQGYTLLHSEYQDGNYERAFSLSDRVD